MNRITKKIRLCTENPLRLFGSKYFAYNESTLQIAEKLGIDYIPARRSAGAKFVSVSNVLSKELGTGSLCDESLSLVLEVWGPVSILLTVSLAVF